MRKILLLTCLLFLINTLKAQNRLNESAAQQNQIVTKPTIMVFPFFKENEDIRAILESDVNRRVVISKVKEAFDNRGYSTVDFISKARNLTTNTMLNDAQTDVKTQIIQASGADIAVEVEYDIYRGAAGNNVKVILTAYETSTSASLSNKVGQSPSFRTEDIGALASKATEAIVVDFLNVMQEKFTDIVINGKYMAIEFGLKEDSEVKMSTEVGTDGLPLSDMIEEWIGNNSKGYHIQGVTELKIIFDQVRIPRTDAGGKNLTPTRYALEIYKFCNTLKMSDTPNKKAKIERLIKGNTIFINFK
ncbi:DUF6175 family protein [Emticicia sp. TH156]|uniref:DUF6175 family protein n=1 Tax=Emticicia sp. TH156 TaxID=2067454 RepID=UPI00117EE7E8|nr:DUF6175 family protein [Emticicia sp. TH156]